jgi:hypothetical protein
MNRQVFEEFMQKRFPNIRKGSGEWQTWEFAFQTGDPIQYMKGDKKAVGIYSAIKARRDKGKPQKYFYGVKVNEEDLPPMLQGKF